MHGTIKLKRNKKAGKALVRVHVAPVTVPKTKRTKPKTAKQPKWKPRPRNPQGQYVKVTYEPTIEEKAATMAALYEWRDERREYDRLLADQKKEARWSPIRGLVIFTLMSAILVGFLFAGIHT